MTASAILASFLHSACADIPLPEFPNSLALWEAEDQLLLIAYEGEIGLDINPVFIEHREQEEQTVLRTTRFSLTEKEKQAYLDFVNGEEEGGGTT